MRRAVPPQYGIAIAANIFKYNVKIYAFWYTKVKSSLVNLLANCAK